jgi:hypothetical protein
VFRIGVRARGVDFCARSRFLEFLIQTAVAETVHARGTRPAHAPFGTKVGGYMREEGKLGGRKHTVVQHPVNLTVARGLLGLLSTPALCSIT